MKKLSVILLSILLSVGILFGITACDGINTDNFTPPSSKYEKVLLAFSGVARSLTSQQGDARAFVNIEQANADEYDTTPALSSESIYALFNASERTNNPDFRYDEPPMIQFQYIKSLYESVGTDYEFGKVYVGTVTGTVNYDFATGNKTKEQNYTAEARIDIDVDEHDVITVHLGLKTIYVHQNETHEQRFYAELVLIYDMQKSTPNYELSVKYIDDCSRFQDEAERTNTYEYDYVSVKDNVINEWNKLYYTSPTVMVKDADHTSFADYANSAKYAGRARAYKDGVKYFTNNTDVNDRGVNSQLRLRLCALLFEQYGLNATDIKADAYFETVGTQSSAIGSTFEKISAIAGQDVIGAFAITGATDNYDGAPADDPNEQRLNNWPSIEIASYFGIDVPALVSANGTITYAMPSDDDQTNAFFVGLSGVTEAEYAEYGRTLYRYGFENIDNGVYVLQQSNLYYYVMINANNGIAFVCSEVDKTSGDDQNGQTTNPDDKEIPTDPEGNENGNGGNVDKPENGETGTGESGQIGENGETGGENGKPENGEDKPHGGAESQGNPDVQVTVIVVTLDAHQNVASQQEYTYNENQVIDVSKFITEEGQHVYSNYYCSDLVEKTINAYSNLYLYVWKQLPKGTFTIYNVTDEGTSLYTSFEDYIGSGYYFGYSFEYLLYWDEGCNNQIPLDYNFDLTEDGITVYRHIYTDYFVLNIKCYVNGHLWPDEGFSNSFGIYRKGLIYNLITSAYGQSIIDFDNYRSWLGADTEFYLGEEKTESNKIDYGSIIATTQNEITVCVYAQNDFHVYTLKAGNGQVITEDYITIEAFDDFYYAEGMGNIFEFKDIYAEYCTRSGNVITLHNTHKMYTLSIKYCWEGRVLTKYTNDSYFTSEFPPSYNGELNTYSDDYFTDVNCTNPIKYTKDIGYGMGEYPITGSTTLYVPYNR